MIPTGVQVFLALEPVDMRGGFDRLAALARERLGYEARSGALFVFVGKRRATLNRVPAESRSRLDFQREQFPSRV